MTEQMRKVREDFLKFWPLAAALKEQDRKDWIDGKVTLREYQGVVILDYSNPYPWL